MMRREIYQHGRLVSVEENAGPPPTADDVRLETLRRLMLAFGARDQAHLQIKVQDATIRGAFLSDKEGRGVALTPEELAEAAYLRSATGFYFACKGVGNAFEAMDPIPADFADDAHWPSMG